MAQVTDLLTDARTWLSEYLRIEGDARKLAFVPDQEAAFQKLADALSSMRAYVGSGMPDYQGFVAPPQIPYVQALRERPLFKLQHYRDKKLGDYVRAYVGAEVVGREGYLRLWLMRKDEAGEWRLVSSSNACTCGTLGVDDDGSKHEDCGGSGWIWRKEGVKPPLPRGEHVATLRVRPPEGKPRQLQEYEST